LAAGAFASSSFATGWMRASASSAAAGLDAAFADHRKRPDDDTIRTIAMTMVIIRINREEFCC
jgi:alkanesulfonate monooxygenase SsuD/methylene tetrahydromethanopterin reductase-like flavin-dependent oxidoreductase (luciferase family)